MNLKEMADKIRNAKTYAEIKRISKHWQKSTKQKVLDRLSTEEIARVWMLKNFANHPICQQFPLGCHVRRPDWDKEAKAIVKGWFESDRRVYVRLFVKWDGDDDGINSQWSFSSPEKLQIILQQEAA
ncbi:MAG: hypothetical protein AAGA60_10760 [Cyanobacteria bacterium P01_E01_bin.42]